MTRRAQPPRAGADIAGTLLHSLDIVDEPDVEEAWAREVQHRIEQVESGQASLIPWTQVRRRLRSTVRGGRQKG